MINENEFYKQVNKRLENINLEQARNIIKNVVRKVPQNMYKLVLDIINDNIELHTVNSVDYNQIDERIKDLKETFKKIKSGELYFRAESYEQYNDWSWESDWYFSYNDEDNISEAIEEAYELAMLLVNAKQYEYAKTLFELILYTDYYAYEDEIGDEIELSLNDLITEDLININLEELCLYTIYSTYQIVPKENRCTTIYEYFSLMEFNQIHVKDAFSLGREIPKDTEEFWYDFAKLLINKLGDVEYNLLKEAVEQLDNNKRQEIVMEAVNTHPQMSLDYLNKLMKDSDNENVIKNGDIILNKMDSDLVIRSKIALIVASALNDTNQKEYVKGYLYEAFVSNTCVANLLKIMFNNSFNEYEKKIEKILGSETIKSHEYGTYIRSSELKRNNVGEKYLKYFNFFLRRL